MVANHDTCFLDPVWKNLAIYFGSFWNWIDVIAILLFLPGMVIRLENFRFYMFKKSEIDH